MSGEQCPLPDCSIPIKRQVARRTEIISHLRDVHKVDLEKSYGGNEATRRKKHGEQFRAWLIRHDYDPNLDNFFTAIDDGLANRTGALPGTKALMTAGSAKETPTVGIDSSSPPQGDCDNSQVSQSISSQDDNTDASGGEHLQYEWEMIDKPRGIMPVGPLRCVFSLIDPQEDNDMVCHRREAYSTVDELLAHYVDHHSHFTFHLQKDAGGPADGEKPVRIVVRLTAETREWERRQSGF